MIDRSRAGRTRILVIDDEMSQPTAEGRAISALAAALTDAGTEVVDARSAADGLAIVTSDAALHAVVLDWRLGDDANAASGAAMTILQAIRARDARVPIFLTADRETATALPLAVLELADEFVWTLEDTAGFVAGRVLAAVRRYEKTILPPMAAALFDFAGTHEYSWHTPGHTGGTAFLKAAAGRAFVDHFGEALVRSDLSISVGELGSLLDHTGAIGAGERYAARVFGADRTYWVTNGSSTANRVIFTASLTDGDIALCDRNAHKSIEHGLTLTGAVSVYLLPTRNHLGLIGPIPQTRLTPEFLAAAIADNPLVDAQATTRATHAVITNSTYDGLCYDARRVTELLDASVDRVHFDEAWFAYARFNPLYRDRFAMRPISGDASAAQPQERVAPVSAAADTGETAATPRPGPTVFATHSTHKLLAALSQASLLHVRDGRSPIDHARLNESFMMHATTSPLYTILASNDIAAAMMDGPGGPALTGDAIREAVAFRQTMRRLGRELAAKGSWFLDVWNPTTVRDPKTGQTWRFEDAPSDLLATEPSCWVLHPGEAWHGFQGLGDDECLLDPIKVSVVTPGVNADGSLAARGIPAAVLTAYLDNRGIEVEKTTDFTILLLFSIGVTKGKWGTLVNAFLDFRADYDANAALDVVMPEYVQDAPGRYRGMGLRDLADAMMRTLADTGQLAAQAAACATLPRATMTPAAAYRHLVRGAIDVVPLADAGGRVMATGIVPYPPGIPILMPGESTSAANDPVLAYLQALETWDRTFPGFGHDTHGVEVRDGRYFVRVLKDATDARTRPTS